MRHCVEYLRKKEHTGRIVGDVDHCSEASEERLVAVVVESQQASCADARGGAEWFCGEGTKEGEKREGGD